MSPRVNWIKVISEHLKKPEGYTVADEWENTVDKYPNRYSLHYVGCDLFPRRSLTYAQVDSMANQVAHWGLSIGLKRDDTVALFMESRIEFFVTWLGLNKIGVRVAFINSTVKLTPLVHSIGVADAKLVIFGHELQQVVKDVYRTLIREHGIECICQGGVTTFCSSMDAEVAVQPLFRPDRNVFRHGIGFDSIMGYIYTSGTTGLPKAVKMSQMKMWAYGLNSTYYLTEEDVIYTSGMPLYHSSAGGIGTAMMYLNGASLVIRRKFSAKQWLQDVREFKVTMFQYIGEICRYIMSQPERPDDGENSIKYATGNGLRPEYWVEFQTRFQISKISEFYGSTEGNGALRNNVYLRDIERGDTSAVGCIGRVLSNKSGLKVVKYDVENNALVRDSSTGFLVECGPNEPGEGIFEIRKSSPVSAFTGYTSKKASNEKLVRNCFKEGDEYVRMGDLLTIDENKWVRFVDRIGDTFRWKGENVSTNEVATELSKFKGVDEVNVYGVQVPNSFDGRAGMAAIVMKDTSSENLDALLTHAQAHLPSYAVPVFLRILPQITVTATFKHQKVKLRQEGMNPEKCTPDVLFWLDPVSRSYMPFTTKEYENLSVVRAKL